jgi:hypothetical protein
MLEGGEMPKTSLTFVLDSNTILRSKLAITKLVPPGNNRLLLESRWYGKFKYMLPCVLEKWNQYMVPAPEMILFIIISFSRRRKG